MTFPGRLIAIALAILLTSFPVAIIITLVLSPFWSWIEKRFHIESFGHSGPAEWCYLVVYFSVATCWTVLWAYKRKSKNKGSTDHTG